MKHISIDLEIYTTFLAVIIILLGLTGFIIYFFVLYKKKQVLFLIEQEKQEVAFRQEILNTQIEVQEQTMQTIGTDLHDNIGQLLSLISFTLNSISTADEARTREKVDSAISLTKKSIREMRSLGKLLQGEQLLSQGLKTAIEQEILWLGRSDQFHVSCEVTGDFPPEKNQEKNLILFRILQEILNNIIKHAQASLIELMLIEKDGSLTMTVRDNGIGFHTAESFSSNEGMGLKNIRRRVNLIDGDIGVESGPGMGTSITIQIPYL
jgi:two-component system NarL family sensor kinase